MRFFNKTWVRVIASLFIGGLFSEIIHITTGDPNRPRSGNETFLMILSAIVIYFLLTSISKKESGHRL